MCLCLLLSLPVSASVSPLWTHGFFFVQWEPHQAGSSSFDMFPLIFEDFPAV